MISKERLKELIEQEKVIYCKDSYFGKPYIREFKLCRIMTIEDIGVKYEILFETKEEAKWELGFGNIERIERLYLPTWEEFNRKYKKKTSPIIGFNGKNPQCFYELFYKDNDIHIFDCDCGEYVYERTLTKENYIEACNLCKKLFLGEE